MKVTLVFILFIAIAVFSVSGTPPPHCAAGTCNPEACEAVNCSCGTYKDQCECCDLCHKCPDEECTTQPPDPCTEGYHCTLDDLDQRMETGGTRHCRPHNETATRLHHRTH
ncbi:8.6 kDa transglutaminase substrate-like [Dermacentor silvarum]|uniref:8.6 kDa transglutaminase substrate-like n=1 Tax=Dermacentor silvarum TaxID=543639 RepID=UPI0021014689|nr:8.6 kDa transglutaminase substrate-like [Dermacentor silvarum]